MKIEHLIITTLMLTALSASSTPFSSEWNWEGKQLRGKVKTITTPTKVDKFNVNGQKTLSQILGKDGSVAYETTLLYNDSGNLWKISFQKVGADNPMYTETASYTSKGLLESVKREGRKGDGGATESIGYDANGHLESISVKMGPMSMAWRYTFSKEGILQSAQRLTDGTVKSEVICTPNSKGDPEKIEISQDGAPSETIETEYQYDDHGNWVAMVEKTTVCRGDKVTQSEPLTRTRTIEYY